ncbi:hypothetical protein QMA40_12050 [Bacillus thuringiensis]|uniref:AbiTii domain-containing protein n=1 Tax=Bacillus thuringiensis TaxID=1428 RepID=UPI0039778E1E
MAKSQLLKDTVSEQSSFENILLRLKVILSNLDNELIMSWIEGELTGYKLDDKLPDYRVVTGIPMGKFIVNGSFEYTDSQVPLGQVLEPDMIKDLVRMPILDTIKTLEEILSGENKEDYCLVVPTELCHGISTQELQILAMKIKCPSNFISKVISNVKSKLVDVIMELEKQYENLDELDIKSQVEENKHKKEKVIFNIENIIFDGSIKMGNNNKIKRSKFWSFFGGEK